MANREEFNKEKQAIMSPYKYTNNTDLFTMYHCSNQSGLHHELSCFITQYLLPIICTVVINSNVQFFLLKIKLRQCRDLFSIKIAHSKNLECPRHDATISVRKMWQQVSKDGGHL